MNVLQCALYAARASGTGAAGARGRTLRGGVTGALTPPASAAAAAPAPAAAATASGGPSGRRFSTARSARGGAAVSGSVVWAALIMAYSISTRCWCPSGAPGGARAPIAGAGDLCRAPIAARLASGSGQAPWRFGADALGGGGAGPAELLAPLPAQAGGGRGSWRRASPPASEGEETRASRGRGELEVCRGSGV